VINPAKDPKGYYIALGVAEDASVDDVKAAFRAKAKRLHPDHNPSPIAAKQFHRVHEAYETLSDPVKRAAYDRGWRTFSNTAKDPGPKAEAKPEPKPQPKPEPSKQEPPKAEQPKPNVSDQPAMCQCGKITAQPRYVIFDMVWGRLNKVHRRGLAGVYCRTCADKAAIKASFVTWIAGWWSWPSGPRETLKALLNNMRGGRKPAERNARLLIKQSRAFRARGDMQLARACAEQALQFASNAGLRREVDSLLLSLSSFPARGIKDRWATPGLAPFIQIAPVAVLVAAVSMTATLSAPMSLVDYAKSLLPQSIEEKAPEPALEPIRSGRIYAVKVDALELKTGPGAAYRVETLLKRGVIVLVTEEDPGGRWVRIILSDDSSGFVEATGLTPDVDVDALTALGAFGAEKAAPEK
jgi:hypothetical protein